MRKAWLLLLLLTLPLWAKPPEGVIPPPPPDVPSPTPPPKPSPKPSASPIPGEMTPAGIPAFWHEVPAPPTLRVNNVQFQTSDLSLPADVFQSRYGIPLDKSQQKLLEYQQEHAEQYFRTLCRHASVEAPTLYQWGPGHWGIHGYTRNPDGTRIAVIWYQGKPYKDFSKLPDWNSR